MRPILLGAGTIAERARLTSLAAAAGLKDDVPIAGEANDVFAWLARAGVFALSSR